MEVESALEQVGDFGRFQAINYLLLCLPAAHTSIYMLTFVFTTGDIPYRCFVPGCDNPNTRTEEQFPSWVQFAIPSVLSGFGSPDPGSDSGGGPGEREKCLRYVRKGAPEAGCDPEQFGNETERCDRWVFPAHQNTIVSEFEVTCKDNKWKRTIVGSLLHVGQMVGTSICGMFSDRFGRRTLLMTIMGMSWLIGMARSLAPSYIAFVFLAWLDATFVSGGFTACFTLGVELVASRQRVLAGAVLGILSVTGCVYLAAVARLLHDWRDVIRVVYIPAAAAVLSVWGLPESVRWLASQGRLREAEEVLARVVRVNKLVVAFPIRLQELTEADSGKKSTQQCRPLNRANSDLENEDFSDPGTNKKPWPVVQVFRSRRLVIRFIATAAIWVINTFVYFGLAICSVSLAGDVYLNFAVSSLVEIPGYLLSWIAAERYGRRATICGNLTLTGASLFCYLAVPQGEWALRLALYCAGKLAITASFTVIFLLTAELFPTSARHTVLGLCSTVGRMGSVLAAQTPLLDIFYHGLPVLLFGSVALGGALLAFLLPETLNTSLPDTVLQAEELGRRRSLESKKADRGLDANNRCKDPRRTS